MAALDCAGQYLPGSLGGLVPGELSGLNEPPLP